MPDNIQAWSEIETVLDDALAAHYSFESVYEGDLDFAKIEIFGRQEQGQPMAVSRNMPAGIREDLVQLSASEIPGQVPALIQSPVLGEGIDGNAFVFDEQNKGYFGADVGDYDRTDAFSLDFWIQFAGLYETATVLNHNQHIRFAGMGYTLDVENNHLRFDIQHTRDNKISVISREAVAPQDWSHISCHL